MPTSTNGRSALVEYPQGVAFSIQLARNLVVQTLGVGMICLVALDVIPWGYAVGWALVMLGIAVAEQALLRRLASPAQGRLSRFSAVVLRMIATSGYALAVLALLARGGPGVRVFAFAVMSASIINVLMRYYRSPAILAASLLPYVGVLAIVGAPLSAGALQQGLIFAALAPTFTVAMFVVQIWTARAQLAGGWGELQAAREAAEAREHAASAASRAKSQFLATMSHELRTPLNGVLGMAQALNADGLTAQQRERVKIIRRSSETLLSVLNDLLDLSKIETSTLELEIVEFDLEHLVRGVAAAYQPLAEKKGLAFDLEIDPAALGQYEGDSARLRRVLYSLVDNAVKFTEAGGVTLRAGRRDDGLVFQVSDTGIGMGGAALEHLFEDFFQEDSTLARRYGGAGIGLAICRELTALMGGTIEAASRPGQGSVLTLSVPLKAILPAQAAPTEAAGVGELRVLAAEDNPTNQLVLKTLLGAAGIEPTIVDDGRKALEAWEHQAWDIVLMDIQMPEMDGVEATRGIRARERATGRSRTPIVAVTANAMTHQVADYRAAGIDGVVPKPIDLVALLGAMEAALAPSEEASRQVL